MFIYQVTKLDIRGREYIATTQDGDLSIKPTDLIILCGGKKGLELCAIVNALAKLVPVCITREGMLTAAEDLRGTLRGQAKSAKARKTTRCACGGMPTKGERVLLHPLGIIVGCTTCTEVEVKPANVEEDEPDHRVVVEGPYDSCLDVVKKTREALRKFYKDRIFRMNAQPGSSLGQVVFLRSIDGLVGATSAEDYNTLNGQCKVLDFGRYKEDADTGERIWCPCAPPQGVITHMLAHKDEIIPVLQGIVRLPLISVDGSVLTDRGYDYTSRVYIAPDVQIEPIADYVTSSDVQEAKALIDHLFTDFPAAYPAAKSALIGCFLDQCVRSSLIDGPAPAYCFEAPTGGEGSGKTIYANVIALLADGSTTAATVWTNNEEELAKQLLPLIESQRSVIMFDNVDGFVISATLDSAITSRVYETRRLGRNSVRDMVRVPFRASVLFTSNGATFQNSLARRMIMIQLDPKKRETSENARGKRAYAIPNIIQHVRDPRNRARYVRAALVIAKAWIQAGRPEDPECSTLHSFETWSDTVPAIVKYAGWPSMKRAVEAASTESNADRKEAEQFVNAWWNLYGSEPIRAGQLGELAIDGGFYVPRMKVSSKGANPAYVGRSINARWMGFIRRWPVMVEGRLVQVEDGERSNGQPTWFLKSLDTNVLEPSWSSEPLDAFDPDGQDYFQA